MNIHKATLSKQVDGTHYAVYPKTSADMVIYDASNTVADKIVALENSIANSDARVSNLVNGANPPSNEVTDARVAFSDSTAKSTLKDRIDVDYKALERRIHCLENGYIYDGIADSNTNLTLTDSNGVDILAVSPLGTIIEQQLSTVFASFRQEIRDTVNGMEIDDTTITANIMALVDDAIYNANRLLLTTQ